MNTEKEPSLDNSSSQMRKGMLEFCALLIISKGEIYPSDILKELKDHDLLVVEGTLYPLLSRLKDSGLLDYTWVESNAGPPRKYYRLTQAGKANVQALKKAWNNLSNSINNLIKKYE